MFARTFPTVHFEQTMDVGFSRNLDVVPSLEDVITIVGRENVIIFKGNKRFIGKLESGADEIIDLASSGFRLASKSKIINLANHKNLFAEEGTTVNVVFMSGAMETKIKENTSDVFFPETSGFRMTLKGMKNGKNPRGVKGFAGVGLVPFDECSIKPEEGMNGRTGRMGKCIFGIATKNGTILSSSKSSKEVEDGLTETGSISVGLGMEMRSSMGRAITAKTTTMLAIGLDPVLPDGTKDGSGRVNSGEGNRITEHLKVVELIKLLKLILVPEVPGIRGK